MHRKCDSSGIRDHLPRQGKVNMESYAEPTGSKPPEAGFTLTDKDGGGKRRACTVEGGESKGKRESGKKVKESRGEIVLFTVYIRCTQLLVHIKRSSYTGTGVINCAAVFGCRVFNQTFETVFSKNFCYPLGTDFLEGFHCSVPYACMCVLIARTSSGEQAAKSQSTRV